jgi:DNA-binding winged helix-turn-helix (wHTH) protein/TolB-like protein
MHELKNRVRATLFGQSGAASRRGFVMQVPTQSKGSYRFGLFELDLARRKLLRKDVPVRVQELPFRLLTILLEHAGEIVSREELRQSLWPEGTYVEFDGSLNAALKKLRYALGDDAENPIFIETVPKRGYRFIAPVECDRPEEINAAIVPSGLAPSPAAGEKSPSSARSHILKWGITGATAILLLLASWRYTRKNQSNASPHRKVIAVLLFSNEGAGPDFDYLRYAIANDLVTDLTYAQSITVRPFAFTSKYGARPADLAAIAQELNVTHVLAGGFLKDQQNLRVNLELTDVAQNKIVWRDEVTIGPQELIRLHQKLAASTMQSLLPAMNLSGAVPDDIPSPKNERAFDLFLHSTMVSLDPGPNQMAIEKLEQSIALDGGYAPAWHQLAWRHYLDYHYGNGGQTAQAKSLAAYKRERELDPNAEPWVSLRVEQGDVEGAYDEVSDFMRRHPDHAELHFSFAYIFRYAGLLDEARKECAAVYAADPVHGFRSCAFPFILSGDYTGAQKYIDLDARSGFAAILRMQIALRTGNRDGALAEANNALQLGYNYAAAKLVRACVSHPPAGLTKDVADLKADAVSAQDPEDIYANAEVLSFCGQPDAALAQLRKAIDGKFCSYPAMDNDPLFASIRLLPGFAEARSAGIQCQQEFLAHRKHFDASLAATP